MNNKPEQARFFYYLTGLCFPALAVFRDPKPKVQQQHQQQKKSIIVLLFLLFN